MESNRTTPDCPAAAPYANSAHPIQTEKDFVPSGFVLFPMRKAADIAPAHRIAGSVVLPAGSIRLPADLRYRSSRRADLVAC